MILTINGKGYSEIFDNVQVTGVHVTDKETTFFLTERNGTEVNVTYSHKVLKDYSYDYDERDWAAIKKIENPPVLDQRLDTPTMYVEIESEKTLQAIKDAIWSIENREARKGVTYLKEALSALEKVEAQTNTEGTGLLFAIGEIKDLIRGREEKTSGSLS